MIDSDRHSPFSNTCIYSPRHLMRLLIAKITIDRVEKFDKLSSAKLGFLLIHQTLIPPNFHHLWYTFLLTHIGFSTLSIYIGNDNEKLLYCH